MKSISGGWCEWKRNATLRLHIGLDERDFSCNAGLEQFVELRAGGKDKGGVAVSRCRRLDKEGS